MFTGCGDLEEAPVHTSGALYSSESKLTLDQQNELYTREVNLVLPLHWERVRHGISSSKRQELEDSQTESSGSPNTSRSSSSIVHAASLIEPVQMDLGIFWSETSEVLEKDRTQERARRTFMRMKEAFVLSWPKVVDGKSRALF